MQTFYSNVFAPIPSLFSSLFVSLFPNNPTACLLSTTQIPLYFSFIIPLTPHFKKTLVSFLNFIPSFSTPFPNMFSHCVSLQFIQDSLLITVVVIFSFGVEPSLPKASGHVSRWSYLHLPSNQSSLYLLLGTSWQELCSLGSKWSSPNTHSLDEKVAGIVVPAKKQGGGLSSSEQPQWLYLSRTMPLFSSK